MARHDAQMLKGVLSLLLLRLLAAEDGYGYAIVTSLKGAGFPDLIEGTVYPVSYTHLDVYKRQCPAFAGRPGPRTSG